MGMQIVCLCANMHAQCNLGFFSDFFLLHQFRWKFYCLNSDDEVFLFLHAMDMDGAVSRFSTIVACARWCYPATRISSPAIFCGVSPGGKSTA